MAKSAAVKAPVKASKASAKPVAKATKTETPKAVKPIKVKRQTVSAQIMAANKGKPMEVICGLIKAGLEKHDGKPCNNERAWYRWHIQNPKELREAGAEPKDFAVENNRGRRAGTAAVGKSVKGGKPAKVEMTAERKAAIKAAQAKRLNVPKPGDAVKPSAVAKAELAEANAEADNHEPPAFLKK